MKAGNGALVLDCLSKGGNPDARDGDEIPALILACKTGHAQIVQAILEHKADPNAIDKQNTGALYHAAFGCHAVIVRLLLQAQANVNARTEAGRTPIMAAALRKHEPTLAVLMDAKADADIKDKNGRTAIEIVAARKLANPNFLDKPPSYYLPKSRFQSCPPWLLPNVFVHLGLDPQELANVEVVCRSWRAAISHFADRVNMIMGPKWLRESNLTEAVAAGSDSDSNVTNAAPATDDELKRKHDSPVCCRHIW